MQRSNTTRMMLALVTSAMVVGASAGAAFAMDHNAPADHGMGMNGGGGGMIWGMNKKPPKGFVEVSKALKVPAMAFIPGLGTLWVDPATLKVGGPFLNYDKKGRLLGSTYMIPLSALKNHKDFDGLGGSIMGMKVDHTDIEWSDAHPGVPEAHVHVTNWYVSRADQNAAVGKYHAHSM